MLDLEVSGRATAGCRQPHMVTGVKVDMAKVCLQLRGKSQSQTTLLSSPILCTCSPLLLRFCKPSIDSFDRKGRVREYQLIRQLS